MATYFCLSSVRAIVQLKEELTRPGTEEARVSMKFREETIWTWHFNPDESHRYVIFNYRKTCSAKLNTHTSVVSFCYD